MGDTRGENPYQPPEIASAAPAPEDSVANSTEFLVELAARWEANEGA